MVGHIGNLLQNHLYLAIVVGSLVEGETTAVLSGFAAHQGHTSWFAVTALVAFCNFVLDQSYFLLGRWKGIALLRRFPALQRGAAGVLPRIHQHRRWFTFGVRFMYGLRTIGPIALGIAEIPWREFIVFNALGAATWAIAFCSLGFVFGRAITLLVGDIAHFEAQMALVVLACGLAYWLWHRKRNAGSHQS